MSDLCQKCNNLPSNLVLFCLHRFCFDCYYLQCSPLLEQLVRDFIESPKNLGSPINFGCPRGCQESCYMVSPYVLLYIIQNKRDINDYQKSLFMKILQFLEFYLSGLPTKFDTCIKCGSIEINNDVIRICCCDQKFGKEFSQFLGYYKHYKIQIESESQRIKHDKEINKASIEMNKMQELTIEEQRKKQIEMEKIAKIDEERKDNQSMHNRPKKENKRNIEAQPYSIWNRLEGMAKKSIGNHIRLTSYEATYTEREESNFREKYPGENKLYLVENTSLVKNRKISLKLDGRNVIGILASVVGESSSEITLRDEKSYIKLYKLTF